MDQSASDCPDPIIESAIPGRTSQFKHYGKHTIVEKIVDTEDISNRSSKKPYDCIVGVSGGVDSSRP